jgi:hypothetical protein
MNLKFLDDIYQTIEVMRNGFYYLGLLAGIHTVTFAAYLAYRYLNDSKKGDQGDSKIQEPELPPPLVENSVLEMQDISDLIDKLSDTVADNDLIDKRKEYKLLLEQKRNELGGLILQLDTVYANIGQIRERLENLNNKTE